MALAAHAVVLYLKASSASAVAGDEVDGINKEDLKINGEQLDTTDFKDTSAWHTFLQGLKDAQIEVSGMVEAADGPQNLIRSSLLTYADLWCTLHRNPGGSAGQKGFKAQVMVESYSESGDVGSLVNFSATLKVTGAVTAE